MGEKTTSKKENKKTLESMKIGLVGLMPELSIFGEERDSNDQKGLARIESISKNIIEMNKKFNFQNLQNVQSISEQLQTNPE